MTRFFMVLGAGTPTVRHQYRGDAEREAERLAKANPGSTFTILMSIAEVKKNDVQWTQHDEEDNYPQF